MIFLIKGLVLLLCAFCPLATCGSEPSNAQEKIEQSIEEVDFSAGVEKALDIDIEVPKKNFTYNLTGYTTARLNVREKPSVSSEIVHTIPFNAKIKYENYNEDWAAIKYKGRNCYISKKYISDKEATYTSYNAPENTGFKSYMSYKAITNKYSKQYKLQQRAATGNYGIRMVDGRYCAVLGSFFKKEIGTYFDLVLENGTVIKCVLSDIKSSIHTKEDNITSFNGCISEFIVDISHLPSNVKKTGDISNCNSEWKSPIVKINFY
jgi:hypothetical protein